MRHKESSIFPRGAMRRGKSGQMTERCWRLRGELRGEQDHASTLEMSHHLPSPSLKQKSKTFFCEFLYKPVKGPSLFTPAFFFSGCCEAKLGLCVQIQKMNYVNVSSRNLQSHKGASWALRSIVRLCLGKRQHQITLGSHVPHVCKYVGETSVGKGVEWKIMLLVSTLVMVEVTTTTKSIKT